MFKSVLSWFGSKGGLREEARPARSPSFEPLEPRVLLSADLLGTEPLAPLEVHSDEQAIYMDLNRQDDTQNNDPSAILTYFTPCDETAPALSDTETAASSIGTPLAEVELGIVISADSEESAALSCEQSACRTPVDRQGDISSTEGFPIEARGPPAESYEALTALSTTTYGQESQPRALVEVESVSAGRGTKAPELPGLQLVDPDISNWQGQIIYLDFDGEQNVTYNGPITIGPFDIPAFQAPGELARREGEIMAVVTATLNDLFAGTGLAFTLSRPRDEAHCSTVYIGGDGSWASEYGSFLGLAEQVDVGNNKWVDNGFVFTDRLSWRTGYALVYVNTLTDFVTHEVGHLLGYEHAADLSAETVFTDVIEAGASPLDHVAYDQAVHTWIGQQAATLFAQMYGTHDLQNHVGPDHSDDWNDVNPLSDESRTGTSFLEGTFEEDTFLVWLRHFVAGPGDTEVQQGLTLDEALRSLSFIPGVDYLALIAQITRNVGTLFDDQAGRFLSALQVAETTFEKAIDEYEPGNEGIAYYWLGRTAHLLMDMTVPPHVHAVSHAKELLLDDLYETWVMKEDQPYYYGNYS